MIDLARRSEPYEICPHREHALISRHEHEVWDVLLACQRQLRLAPSGHVAGIDMHAAVTLATLGGTTSPCSRSYCPQPRWG